MKEQVAELIARGLKDEQLKKVVSNIIEKNSEAFYLSPASCGHHHSFTGGLAQHSVSTAKMAMTICSTYREQLATRHGTNINEDVVVAGAFLHDIGKIQCYKQNSALTNSFIYTQENMLHHHIPIGFHILASEIESTYPDYKFKNELLHIIISHHGKVKWSSPREPKTTEAFIVHQADNLDAWIDHWGSKFNKNWL